MLLPRRRQRGGPLHRRRRRTLLAAVPSCGWRRRAPLAAGDAALLLWLAPTNANTNMEIVERKLANALNFIYLVRSLNRDQEEARAWCRLDHIPPAVALAYAQSIDATEAEQRQLRLRAAAAAPASV
jgi:hypothetical protein